MSLKSQKSYISKPAFTIVELIIVVVVIGILAVITLVTYSGIAKKAAVASMVSDLSNASRMIKMYQIEYDSFPASIDCSTNPSVNSICIKNSSGNTYAFYNPDNTPLNQSFCLGIKNGTNRYYISNNSQAQLGTCLGVIDGLVAYYPFDNNALDFSGNSNNGVAGSGASIASSNINSGYLFKSTSGAVTVPNSSSLNFGTNSFTISYWAFHNDYAYPKTFGAIKKSNPSAYAAGGIGWDFGHGYKSTGIDACINDGTNLVRSTLVFNAGSQPPDLLNKWVYMTYVINRDTDRILSYINGTKQTFELDISSVTGSIDNTSSLTISTMYGWYVDGLMDEVRIYNRALTSNEINTLYGM